MRVTSPRPALIEQEHMVAFGIEDRTVQMLAAGAWPAMQKHARASAPPAHFLHVDPVTIAGGNHACIEGAQVIAVLVVSNHEKCL